MPHEIAFGEIYGPPLLAVVALAYLLMLMVSTVATKLGWYKWFASPALVELSLVVIFTVAIGQFIAFT